MQELLDPSHSQSSMPSARRSTEPARPVSEIPILNAALLNTEADVVAALVVPEPDVVPPS